MGAGTLNPAVDGTPIPANDHNELVIALIQDLLPRHSDYAVTDIKGSLGSAAFRWLRAYIASGYWAPGDEKMHKSFNGLVGPGHGWMLEDGRLINQTNYDLEHGAGSWAIYIGTSPLDGLYLPDYTKNNGVFPVGAPTTGQDGSTPFTTVGNASHDSAGHSHTVNSHTHDLSNHTHGLSCGNITDTPGADNQPTRNVLGLTTGTRGPSTNTSGAASPGTDSQIINVEPEAFETQFYMRII